MADGTTRGYVVGGPPRSPAGLAVPTVVRPLTTAQTAPTIDAPSAAARALQRPNAILERGDEVGRYVIVDRLGSGGMGIVYAAYDPSLDRRVAIKLLHADLFGSTMGPSRLLREAQAMAKLKHRNVVGVHDAGKTDGTDGTVWVAMEHVAGKTLRRWLADDEPGRPAILRALVAAGRGLAAAHAADIVHRDFKPDNVMIETDAPRRAGSEPRVVVMDFGLAHAVGCPEPFAADGSVPTPRSGNAFSVPLTRAGDVIGTPRYMAPEQLAGLATDPRTDQFSFCVSLWESLFGAVPFGGPSLFELAEQTTAGPPPPEHPHLAPRHIRRALERGLAGDPALRWPSMEALLAELERDPTRKRKSIAVGALGGGVALWLAVPADRELPCRHAQARLEGVWDRAQRDSVDAAMRATGLGFADRAAARTTAALDRYAQDWATAHTDACEATRVRGTQSEAVLDLRMACLDDARRELSAAARALADADETTVERAHVVTGGLPSVARCAEVARLQADDHRPAPEDAEAVALVMAELTSARASLRVLDVEPAHAAVERAESLLSDVDDGRARIETMLLRADVHVARSEHERAATTYAEVRRLASAQGHWRAVRAATLGQMGSVGHWLRRTDEVRALFDLALGLSEDDPVMLADTYTEISAVVIVDGDTQAAEAASRRALELYTDAVGADDPRALSARRAIASAYFTRADYERAAAELEPLVGDMREAYGETHPEVARALNYLASARSELGQHAEAIETARAALAVWQASFPDDHPNVGTGHMTLASTYHQHEQYERAAAHYRQAIRRFEAAFGPDHSYCAVTRSNLAKVLAGLGAFDEAVAHARAALESWLTTSPAVHPNTVDLYQDLARVLVPTGELVEAEAMLRKALAAEPDDLSPHEHGDTLEALARVVAADPARGTEARALALEAVAAYEAAGPTFADAAAKAWALADAHR